MTPEPKEGARAWKVKRLRKARALIEAGCRSRSSRGYRCQLPYRHKCGHHAVTHRYNGILVTSETAVDWRD